MTMSALDRTSPFVVRDAIAMPGADEHPVRARAARTDGYTIHVTRTLDDAVERLARLLDGVKVAMLTDDVVMALHGRKLVDALASAGVDAQTSVLPAGERSKCLEQASRVWDWLAAGSIGRRDVLLAFGGGVINDTGGWVASGYMRGIPYVNLPTTLLAQVDGALGGKVAVNHRLAKNLLGAFYQPLGVVSNIEYLQTIEGRHLRAGLAEAIKKAVIASPAYWDFIERNLDAILEREPAALERLVRAASAIKTALVGRDPYEDDLRRPLNFGHTIGHPLETVTGYGPLLHGEAVAFGMVVESRIAHNRGLLGEETLARIVELLRRAGLPTMGSDLPVPADADAIVGATEKVRLIRAGSLRWVLPKAFGETAIADDVTEREVRRALRESGVTGVA
ncbi:MAG: 3-dehydroquinate synthase family protein [Solirubrobacteraceae bacterium]